MAADEGLKQPVVVSALGINASSLPAVFSPAYQQYVLSQTLDFVNVAGKANEAGKGAYDAQVKNDQQDVILADHESRITQAESTLANHETRITAAEAELVDHEARIAANEAELADHETRIADNSASIVSLDGRLDAAETDIDNLQADYVSKSATTNQSVQSAGGVFLVGSVPAPTTDKLQVTGSVNVSVSYKVAGTQVLSARQTGWTAATGTAYKGAFNADTTYSVGVIFDILQIQAIAAALTEARKRIKALEDAMRTHGQIN